jgi:hypothetical protein
MQSLEDYRLRGLISPSVSPRARPMSLAAAQRITGTTPTPAARRPVAAGRKPATATRIRTTARGEGVQWISESRANADLPPGRYKYRDGRGHIIYRDVGAEACRQSLLDRRLHRADITGGSSDREARDGVAVRAAGRFQMVVR